MKIREIIKSDIDVKTSFSPIREIILFDDTLWEKFKEDNSRSNLVAVEALFGANQIFPDGLSPPFHMELGKFMASLDVFRCTLSLLSSLTLDNDFANIIHDYRMSIQNFQIFIEVKSYYSAFMEFRKMLEGVLWMRYMIENNTVPEKVTTMNYQSMLRKVSVKFGDAYSKFNNLFHYKEETPFIQINKIYNEDDHLFDMLFCINELAEEYEQEISRFVDCFDNKSMKRYKVLLTKLHKSQLAYTYKLENYPITSSGFGSFEKGQKQFEDLIKKYNIYKFGEFKNHYELGIKKLSNTFIKIPKHTTLNISMDYLTKIYSNEFTKYKFYMNGTALSLYAEAQEHARINAKKNTIYKKSLIICTSLLKEEVSAGGDKVIAFLRSLFEDICLNAALGKNIGYAHTKIISNVMKKEFDISIPPMDHKFSHLLRDDRPIYRIANATPAQIEQHKVHTVEFESYLDIFSLEIKNIKVNKK